MLRYGVEHHGFEGWITSDGQRLGEYPVLEPFRLITDPVAGCSLNQ